jgi:GMP synthase (glutamine-hydrolysing)
MTRILILRTGSTAIEVQRHHGDYDRWFIDAMQGHDLEFEVRDLVRGDPPDPDGHDGILITGSTSSAFQQEPWMAPLAGFLRRAEPTGVPILGVCFGSQFLAQARGGSVILNPAGWEIGCVQVEVTPAGLDDPIFAGVPSRFQALATHEDRIETLPPGGVLLAGNTGTPVQAFRVGPSIWGVQFHPELSIAALDLLIRLRADVLERDAITRGLPSAGHVDRLRDSLRHPQALQGQRVLQNFAAHCAARAHHS